jgi:tetratricopeptide (TPR) repeat protein
MEVEDYERAYQCLQTTIYLEPRCPSFWITLSILYFNIGQNKDSLDALTKAVGLNAHIHEPWYNLGVLVSFCLLNLIRSLSNTKYSMTAVMANIQTLLMLFTNVLSGSQNCRMFAHVLKLSKLTSRIVTMRFCAIS